LSSSEVDIGWCQVLKALVIPLVIVVFDEGFDLVSKVRRLEVVLQQNAVLHLSVL